MGPCYRFSNLPVQPSAHLARLGEARYQKLMTKPTGYGLRICAASCVSGGKLNDELRPPVTNRDPSLSSQLAALDSKAIESHPKITGAFAIAARQHRTPENQ